MAGDARLADARIVGARQAAYSKTPTRSTLDLLVDTIADACAELGLQPTDIDGLAVSSFRLPPDNVVTLAEQLGVELRWARQGAHGGAAGVVTIVEAAEAITAGRASVVVCAAADAFDTVSHMSLLGGFNTGMRDYLAPYGFGGTNGIFAMVEEAHRSLHGTRREDLGTIAVTQRRHAQLNPNALLRQELTLEDYLSARLIADPIRLYDCVMPCSGADVVVLTRSELARDLGIGGAVLLAGEQRHNHRPAEALSLVTGAAAFADELFATAGVSRSELDFVQLYDDYPIMVAIQLEDLGFTSRGGLGRFLAETDISRDGDLPLNTGGGQLSCGQAGASGGMLGPFEAATQLLGEAGDRQLDAELGLVSGFGMVGYGRGLSSAAMILCREDTRP